jgi:2-methylcitrate dehydratase PrpD
VAALDRLSSFVTEGAPPPEARARAAAAIADTVGVALAGSTEPVSIAVRAMIQGNGNRRGSATVWGASGAAGLAESGLANGTAAHALDFDDMCFVSLAHPSAPLVPAIVAAGESEGASGRALLEAYAVGFEVQARLGRLMNPRHYARGWHSTSTLGTLSAAAGAARLLGLDGAAARHALGIAASSASGLKENFGTMTKPLHAGLAARNGLTAALLARAGLTASAGALDGPQGFLRAFDSEGHDLLDALADLGQRWELLDTGVTVKLYPSCAGTHPTLDALLDLRRRHGFAADAVHRVVIDVDPVVPTILLYERPASGLEAKFSMPYCAAAAIVFGGVTVTTFEPAALSDPRVVKLLPRVTMRVDERLGSGKPALTEARVHVLLVDGRKFVAEAHGARGYPTQPASAGELAGKFLGCAEPVLGVSRARSAWEAASELEALARVTDLTRWLSAVEPHGRLSDPGA